MSRRDRIVLSALMRLDQELPGKRWFTARQLYKEARKGHPFLSLAGFIDSAYGLRDDGLIRTMRTEHEGKLLVGAK